MTYANDCIEMQQRQRKYTKRIEDHSIAELNAAVEVARRKFGDDFWVLLHGIDAYMERRNRRRNARTFQLPALRHDGDDWLPWGGRR